MEIEFEIVENNKRSSYVYQNDKLLYYSIVKFSWFKEYINIYNQDDDLILEFRIGKFFTETKYKILFQNENLLNHIVDISDDNILFDKNKRLIKKYNNRFISVNWNYHYIFRDAKIAQVKQNLWKSPLIISLNINEEYSGFLQPIIIHILATKSFDSGD